MASENLERLASAKQLKAEPPNRKEFAGLLRLGRTHLNDARKSDLALENRFTLGYGAAHALSLAALRWHGIAPRIATSYFSACRTRSALARSTGGYLLCVTNAAIRPSTEVN